MEYSIKINEFEGPLDLLLHLIKESNINIQDISIDKITKQYLDYINSMKKLDLEIASSYLVMASELMLIKSNSLLPKNKNNEEDEESDEISRESLINRLIEYERYKELTKNLKELESKRKEIYTKAPTKISNIIDKKITNDTGITIDNLLEAFKAFLERKDKEKPLTTKITSKEYSVRKRKDDIKKYLQEKKKAVFTDLVDKHNKSYIVVTFISILELAKENTISLKQEEKFSNIYIELKNM